MSELFPNGKCKVETLRNGKRTVLALTDIKAGETILQEQPVLLWSADGKKRCSNCYQLTELHCKVCQISPLCVACQRHNQYDCQKLNSMSGLRVKELLKYNEIYGVVKCLLLWENPLTETYFYQLLGPILEQKETLSLRPQAEKDQMQLKRRKALVQSLLASGFCKYLRHCKKITPQFLMDLYSLLEVDGFEIRAPDNQSMSGFYLQGALLAHNCISNTVINIDEFYAMKIYASCDISKNTEITHCYVNVLLGTRERRALLWEGKGIQCNCRRCEDPTELGSHMSTLLCGECHRRDHPDQYLIPEGADPTRYPAYFYCKSCNLRKSSEEVNRELSEVQKEISLIQSNGGNIYQYEQLLGQYTPLLHPHHFLMIDMKQNMAVILRDVLNDVSNCPGRYVYQRKIRLCQDILSVLTVIQPGISRLKAIALYELVNTRAEFHRLLYQEKDLSKAELVEYLKEAERDLRESIRMLLYEPKNTPEGQLTRSMLRELKCLQTDIKMLK